MIWIENALSKHLNRPVHISDFERDDDIYRGGFECLSCGAKLIARKGTINAHHFASKTPHDPSCEYLQSKAVTDSKEAQYLIDLNRFSNTQDSTVLPGSKEGGRPEGSTNKHTYHRVETLQRLVELDDFLENGSITRQDIKGIEGRNWENFFIKELTEDLIAKIEDNESRNRQQVFVFKGKVNKIWNNPYGGFINIKGKKFDQYISSVQIHIPRIEFTKEALDDFNDASKTTKEEIAVIGVPTIDISQNDEGHIFKIVKFEIAHEEWDKHIYQLDE